MKTVNRYLHTVAFVSGEYLGVFVIILMWLVWLAPANWPIGNVAVIGTAVVVFLIIEPLAWVSLTRKKEELEKSFQQQSESWLTLEKDRDHAKRFIAIYGSDDKVRTVLKAAAIEYQTELNTAEMAARGQHDPPLLLDTLDNIKRSITVTRELHDRAVAFRYSFDQLRLLATEEGIKNVPTLEGLLEEPKEPPGGNGR